MARRNIYDPAFVRQLFDEMAATYGIVNMISSFGFARRWRRQCVGCMEITDGAAVVDLMTGMGELLHLIASRTGPHGQIMLLDISPAMCRVAAKHQLDFPYQVVEADVLQHGLPDESYDYVVSSFGLKTFNSEQLAELAEVVFRLLRPGGQFAFLEISLPRSRLLRIPYYFYISYVIPLIGRIFLGNPENYRLLGEYTRAFRDCREAYDQFAKTGLEVEYRSFFFGCATAIVGRRPRVTPNHEPQA